ncbi:hypothetical protein [Yoonia vestfoldensis]|uniref:hypothetical protein n=1 Tax=Yoonia vestfoldensis TaxID=245188 RepID=UPI000378F2E2|nr:hypothetical protein [Yoonia vestfoldensis]
MRDHIDADRRAATIHLIRGQRCAVLMLQEEPTGELRVIGLTTSGRETLALTHDITHAHAISALARLI